VSEAIVDEYETVLARPELDIRKGERLQLMQLIKNRSHFVAPTYRVHASRDPDDNKFLDCAEAARAD